MKVFVSYSFRPENKWVEDYVIPLVEFFGHEVVTGRVLDSGAVDDEVKRKIRQCRRVLCFVTAARPRRDENGTIVEYEPPDWVRDELMMARGADRPGTEFREKGVVHEGAAAFRSFVEFSKDDLAKLLVDLAERVSQWPVGPLQLRLVVPGEVKGEIERAAVAGNLRAKCTAIESLDAEPTTEELNVHMRDGQLIVPFWVKPNPNLSVEIEITFGEKRLACRGISPAVSVAPLAMV